MTARTAQSEYACPVVVETCCSVLESAFDSDDPAKVAIAQRSLNSAWEIIYALSGRQFGLCELTIRPCRTDCCDPCSMSGPRWTPVLIGGEWTNVSCGRCKDTCSCGIVCDLYLPGPIDSIVSAKVDGQPFDISSLRIDNRSTVVRMDGECWPTCQDMGSDDDAVGTYSITYMRGRPLPEAGVTAVGELACELVKACLGDDSCCLPKRVTSVTRQGVSFAILDPMTFINEGLTGIYLVDLWLRSVNPKGRPRKAAIISPDMPNVRRTTWP